MLKHVNQPNDLTCVSACLAMVTGEDIDTVIDSFHDNYFAGAIDIVDYLDSKDIVVSVQPYKYYRLDQNHKYVKHSIKDSFEARGIYFVTVNSLNYEDTLHQIIVHVADTITVYDPQYGRPGKSAYSFQSLEKEFNEFVAIDCIIFEEDYRQWLAQNSEVLV